MSSIATMPFGNTGHTSTRIIFGAAAIGAMQQPKADQVLETLLEFGINHIDVAAMYGDAELRLAPFLRERRDEFFLATKTRDRSRQAAAESIDVSLARMEVDQIDLIQLHNLTEDDWWEEAMAPGGALEALVEARDSGKVRFLGVTGHGTRAAELHLRSLERFPFDSVLLPYNYTMMQNPQYARDFRELVTVCKERGVAVQTIKSIARRRWRDGDESKKFSWYEPIKEPEAIERAINWALHEPGVFVNTSSDATLLRIALEAASNFEAGDVDAINSALAADVAALGIEPIFVPGGLDQI
ncbi:MAG: aryl-alcohol dehydrogenase-like predicted oxidoreductase [Myxococcota bacterium]|jgi:aryl-alcohol dehydrogenase-like predicted oxidoreductase